MAKEKDPKTGIEDVKAAIKNILDAETNGIEKEINQRQAEFDAWSEKFNMLRDEILLKINHKKQLIQEIQAQESNGHYADAAGKKKKVESLASEINSGLQKFSALQDEMSASIVKYEEFSAATRQKISELVESLAEVGQYLDDTVLRVRSYFDMSGTHLKQKYKRMIECKIKND